MTVQLSWETIEEYPFIRYDFNGLWDWGEVDEAHQAAFKEIKNADFVISLLFDMTASVDLPIGALSASRRMMAIAPDNLGLIVVVSDDEVTQTTFTMLSKFDPGLATRIVTVPDMHAAQVVLSEYHLEAS